MSKTHDGLPVEGYRPQLQGNVDQVNVNKRTEERVLRMFDALKEYENIDQRWLAIGRTHIEEGFMAMNRAIFRPSRVKLPDDAEEEKRS